MEHSGREYIQQAIGDDPLAWRANELSRCQPSTVKTSLHFLNGLFAVSLEEGWVESNVFEGLTKRVKHKETKKDVVTLDEADQKWKQLPRHQQLLWHILRFAGAHASEVGGLRWEDIDLQEETIRVKRHTTGSLKNVFRDRVIPIHPHLLPILRQEKLDEPCGGLIFPGPTAPSVVVGRVRPCTGPSTSGLTQRRPVIGQPRVSDQKTSMSQSSAGCLVTPRRHRPVSMEPLIWTRCGRHWVN